MKCIFLTIKKKCDVFVNNTIMCFGYKLTVIIVKEYKRNSDLLCMVMTDDALVLSRQR